MDAKAAADETQKKPAEANNLQELATLVSSPLPGGTSLFNAQL